MVALTIVSYLVLGAMVAADLKLRLGWSVALSVALGVLNGYLNGSAMAGAKLGLVGLAGIVSALFVVVALAAALAVAQPAPWARSAVRVAGSWVAAAGLLLWVGRCARLEHRVNEGNPHEDHTTQILAGSVTPVAVAVLTLALACAHSAMAQNAAAADDMVVKGAVDHYDSEDHARKPETAQQVELKKKYSPYAGRKFPTRVYFGDTHHHTANSGDAFMAGDR